VYVVSVTLSTTTVTKAFVSNCVCVKIKRSFGNMFGKKKKKRKKGKKKKKIPCSQWCRMLAWGNRVKRSTDKKEKRKT